MSIFPESQLGIWLNTHIKYLEQTAEKNLRAAQNDPHWCRAANDHTASTDSAYALTTATVSTIKHVPEASARNQFAFVKFSVVSGLVAKRCNQQQLDKEPTQPSKVVDLGCALQPLKSYLFRKNSNLIYTGVDKQPSLFPDVLADITHPLSGETLISVKSANVLLMLDVLPELHTTADALHETLSRISSAALDTTLIIISIPQTNTPHNMNSDISGDENKCMNLSRNQWLDLLSDHFIIEQVQGFGYLTARPYRINSHVDNLENTSTGKLTYLIKNQILKWDLLKMFDLVLSLSIGKLGLFKQYSNSTLIVARPRGH